MSEDMAPPVLPTLAFKLPIFLLGVAIGMAVFWVALLWVPAAMRQVASAVGG